MRVSFIQCPAWLTTTPPFALALLGNVLENNGHEVKCLDLNVELYHSIKKSSNSKKSIILESWNHNKIEIDNNNINYVKGLIKDNIRLINNKIDEVILFDPHIICFSVHNTSALFSLEFTKILKKQFPNKIIFWGGPYCFAGKNNLEYLINEIPEIDAICSGDGEHDLPNIFSHFELNGYFAPVNGYSFRDLNDEFSKDVYLPIDSKINDIAFSDYNLFDFENYSWECVPVIASRGCSNRCSFCNEWTCWSNYQFRSPDKIVAEIKYLKKNFPQIKSFWLTCSNLNGDIKLLNELCELLINEDLNILWESQLSIRKTVSIELLVKMKKAGCNYINYGLESSSNKILKLMNKGYNKKIAYQVIQDTIQANLNSNFNIVLGFPGERTSDFIETLFFIKYFAKYGIHESVAICNIVINSKLYNEYQDYSILNFSTDNWFTIGSRNTPFIRKIRLSFSKQLYNSQILNLFFIQKNFLSFVNWFNELVTKDPTKRRKVLMRELSANYFQYNLKYTLIVINKPILFTLNILEYSIFYIWIIYLFLVLNIVEFFSVTKDLLNSKSSREKLKNQNAKF
jgi:radical SAM superfamily enzyme YgiQ (UPF0313 family)